MSDSLKLQIRQWLLSLIGMIILGLAINLLSWQYKLVSGGLPGYGLVVNYLTGFGVGTFLLIANTIILLFSFLIAGKTAGLRGVFGYIFFSLFVDLSRDLLQLQQAEIFSFATNLALVSLQGFIAPIGIALVISCDYSFGSYSSILPIANKFKPISPPLFFFAWDFLLSLITLAFFGWEKSVLLLVNALVFFVVFKYALLFFAKIFPADKKVLTNSPKPTNNK